MYLATDPSIDFEHSSVGPLQTGSVSSKYMTRSFKANDAASLILVAEQDDDTRLMLKYLLKIWKYQVIEASDGEEAVQKTLNCQPDLILLNVKLQETDALINRRQPDLAAHASSEIVLICDRADDTVHAAAHAHGISDFLIKPIDFGKLEKILDQRLRRNLRLVKNTFKEAA
jgi:DNA-binding response OmpR family regulator